MCMFRIWTIHAVPVHPTLLLCCSCLNLVYLLVVVWGIICWAWGSNKTWTSATAAVVLQCFTGAHILLLYLAQLPLLQLPVLDLPFDILGLYKLSREEDDVDPARGVFATQLAHLIFLHLLYAMLGFYTSLLRSPQYQQLAAAVRAASKPARQQQAGAAAGSNSSRAANRPGGRLSGIDELLAPLTEFGPGLPADEQDSAALAALAGGSSSAGSSTRAATRPMTVGRGSSKPPGGSAGAGAEDRALLPSTSLRGLLRGERQDWGPIQRFIAEAAADDPGGSSSGIAAPDAAAVRVIPPAVTAAALAAATSAAAGGNTDSPQSGASADGAAVSAAEPLLMPGGPSPEPLLAGKAPRGRVSGLQQALAQQAAGQGAAAGLTRSSSGLQPEQPDFSGSFGQHSAAQRSTAAASFAGSAAAVDAFGRWQQAVVLLQVLLPFLVSCGEFLLLQLTAAPAVAGIAIAGFALVQVSAQVESCSMGLRADAVSPCSVHWLAQQQALLSTTLDFLTTVMPLVLLG